ncbi:bifunctional alpha/beta hydrolase/OsmC family protein [Wenzhouxiangella sp. XN24]|uniref:bifunctional alpha/beta hydrolase/OsmC family protein n=1 Tax=Wenzhouxiangella sp. XN24 TaxID=2713569 RepID=UPI0013EA25B1|nr:bifunctional alpha/beta hydrolase/OsmC family protein [Wenzhouxiangella sp. XN24]NGX16268.1 OsmC family protein [Wenzhouxiangella sp. XN24]
MAEERIRFMGTGGEWLVGRITRPSDGAPHAWALFAHCFTCSKSIAAATRISRALAERGFGVLRFDFTGIGESAGDFADTNFSSNIEDLLAAADWMRSEARAPRLLVGHSLGGTAALEAAARIEECVAVATIGAPARADHVEKLFGPDRESIMQDGEATVDLGGRPFNIKRQFIEDLRKHDMPRSLRKLRRAMLVMHSPQDEVVAIDNASELFSHALHPKSFVSLDGANHLLTGTADSRYVAEVVAAWASRYLPEEDVSTAAAPQDAPQEEGRIFAHTGMGAFRTELQVAGHALIADEPVSLGGDGAGPGPYDLLGAALAACTSMTLQMYLARKKWPAEAIDVTVRHDRIHAADCADCGTREGKVDRFRREVHVTGALDEAQRARLHEIADMCPVHRTLESRVQIETVTAHSPAPAGPTNGD